MKRVGLLAVALIVLGLGSFGAGYSIGYGRAHAVESRLNAGLQATVGDLEARLRPFEAKQRAVVRINEEVSVPAGMIKRFTFSPALVPGTLSGTWRSSGRGWGGLDDAITAFRLVDPRDVVLADSPRGSSGSFLVKVSKPGTYSLFFDNGGLLRSTPRRVFLEAEFRPE